MKIYINSMNMSLILLFLINVVSGCSNYEHAGESYRTNGSDLKHTKETLKISAKLSDPLGLSLVETREVTQMNLNCEGDEPVQILGSSIEILQVRRIADYFLMNSY